MSQPPFIPLDEFDGTHGYVKTRGFVNYEVDLDSHLPRQKVVLGDSSLGKVERPCVVYAENISLEPGCGYYFGGFDNEWVDGSEIQLCLRECGWASKFYDPTKS